MDQGANPDFGITCATFSVEDVQNDVENRQCRRKGCSARAADDSDYCAPHAEVQRGYQAAYMQRRRATWIAAGKCGRCGGRRSGTKETCIKCRVSLGRVDVENDVENHAERVASRIVSSRSEADGFLRKRFKGGKRGAPGIDEQDKFERKILEQGIERYVAGCKWLASPEGKRAPREDRDDARLATLGQLALAVRAADDILDRNRYAEKRERERQRQVKSLHRRIGGRLTR